MWTWMQRDPYRRINEKRMNVADECPRIKKKSKKISNEVHVDRIGRFRPGYYCPWNGGQDY